MNFDPLRTVALPSVPSLPQENVGSTEPLTSTFISEGAFFRAGVVVGIAILEAGAQAGLTCICGLLLRKIGTIYANHLLGMSAGIFVTTVVIKCLKEYNVAILNEMTRRTCIFLSQYPNIKLIASLFGIIITQANMWLGVAVYTSLGVVGALSLETEQYRHLQQIWKAPTPSSL